MNKFEPLIVYYKYPLAKIEMPTHCTPWFVYGKLKHVLKHMTRCKKTDTKEPLIPWATHAHVA